MTLIDDFETGGSAHADPDQERLAELERLRTSAAELERVAGAARADARDAREQAGELRRRIAELEHDLEAARVGGGARAEPPAEPPAA